MAFQLILLLRRIYAYILFALKSVSRHRKLDNSAVRFLRSHFIIARKTTVGSQLVSSYDQIIAVDYLLLVLGWAVLGVTPIAASLRLLD